MDEGQSCNANYGDFPTDEYNWASYAYFSDKETVFACGGDTTGNSRLCRNKQDKKDCLCITEEFEKKCYEFTAAGVTESATVLESDRLSSDGIPKNGELYLIGGSGLVDGDSTVMEHAAPGGSFQSGPTLESEVFGPCVVNLDDNSILMAGGYKIR